MNHPTPQPLPATRRHSSHSARLLALATLITLLAPTPTATAQDVNTAQVLWEFPAVTDIRGADDLIAELRHHIGQVLSRPSLAPLYISHADQESVGYTVYQEPGRIVTTLAWAYPHLDPDQQRALRSYVQSEFNNPTNAPWGVTSYGKNNNSNYPLPHQAGYPRELHPRHRWWYARSDFGNNRPFLHTLYGAWLYGHQTGDWLAVSNHWPDIRRVYSAYADSDAYKLYGTLSTHLSVLRLAHRFNDPTTFLSTSNRLASLLQQSLQFDAVESIARGTPGNEWRSPYGSYPGMYDSRMDSSTYHGWMFLNLTPELGRFLATASPTLRDTTLARHQAGKNMFPLWWIPKASYFNRSWTGDEGSGLVPEVLGMIAPVERWVAQADAPALRLVARSAPNGIGDCYWLEALVQAIQAHGTLRWIDVRRPPPTLQQAARLPTGAFRVTVTGATGQHYVLQQSPNLVAWTSLTTNPAPYHFTNELANNNHEFYRAQ